MNWVLHTIIPSNWRPSTLCPKEFMGNVDSEEDIWNSSILMRMFAGKC